MVEVMLGREGKSETIFRMFAHASHYVEGSGTLALTARFTLSIHDIKEG